jgi:2'-5' RNA ligase
MIRTFIAIDIPQSVQEAMERLSLELRKAGAAVTWVKPGRMHLTLKFLGNVPPEKIDEISKAMAGAATQSPPFALRPEGCGAFPGMKNMRVVWVGLQGDLDPLKRLQQRVEEAMESLGFEREERSFKPHLTLGRVKGRKNMEALQQAVLSQRDFALEAFDVFELVLYKSELRPEGAHYTPLFRARFSPR